MKNIVKNVSKNQISVQFFGMTFDSALNSRICNMLLCKPVFSMFSRYHHPMNALAVSRFAYASSAAPIPRKCSTYTPWANVNKLVVHEKKTRSRCVHAPSGARRASKRVARSRFFLVTPFFSSATLFLPSSDAVHFTRRFIARARVRSSHGLVNAYARFRQDVHTHE